MPEVPAAVQKWLSGLVLEQLGVGTEGVIAEVLHAVHAAAAAVHQLGADPQPRPGFVRATEREGLGRRPDLDHHEQSARALQSSRRAGAGRHGRGGWGQLWQ